MASEIDLGGGWTVEPDLLADGLVTITNNGEWFHLSLRAVAPPAITQKPFTVAHLRGVNEGTVLSQDERDALRWIAERCWQGYKANLNANFGDNFEWLLADEHTVEQILDGYDLLVETDAQTPADVHRVFCEVSERFPNLDNPVAWLSTVMEGLASRGRSTKRSLREWFTLVGALAVPEVDPSDAAQVLIANNVKPITGPWLAYRPEMIVAGILNGFNTAEIDGMGEERLLLFDRLRRRSGQ